MRGLMIVNAMRQGRLSRTDLIRLSACLDSDLHITRSLAEGRDLARDAVRRGARLIVAVGGDGTVHGLCDAVVGSPTALAIIPCGSANDLAAGLDVRCTQWQALTRPSECHTRALDLIRVNGRHFATVGGLGFAADVVQDADRLRRSGVSAYAMSGAGRWSYLLALGASLRKATRSEVRVEIEFDGHKAFADVWCALIANQPSLGHVFEVAPAAQPDDGRCDLVLLPRCPTLATACRNVACTLWPRVARETGLVRIATSHLTIRCDRRVRFFGDGELMLYDSEFRIDVLPAALTLLLPPGADWGRLPGGSHPWPPEAAAVPATVHGRPRPMRVHRALLAAKRPRFRRAEGGAS